MFTRLAGYSPVSFCDWGCRVCAVLYVSGCNLKCPTCHNKKIAYLNEFEPYDKNFVIQDIKEKQKKGWLNHVVVTGGEACLNEDISLLLEDLKREDLNIKVDTNGKRPDIMRLLLKENLVDAFAVDIKAPWDKYPQVTGHTFEKSEAKNCLSSIFYMAGKGNRERFFFRTTKVPFLKDKDIDTIKSYLPEHFNLTVQKYREP